MIQFEISEVDRLSVELRDPVDGVEISVTRGADYLQRCDVARLIARAPAMLDALREVETYLHAVLADQPNIVAENVRKTVIEAMGGLNDA